MNGDVASTVRIRRATRDDVDAIVRLANAGGPAGPREPLPDELPHAYYDAFEAIDADPRHALMVADVDGVVVGTFHLTFLPYLAGRGRLDLQIEAVHVVETHRNRGIGGQMMRWAIDEARRAGCRRVQLTSDVRRPDAHRFYERLGFVPSHVGMKLAL